VTKAWVGLQIVFQFELNPAPQVIKENQTGVINGMY
jgi:hypothetical protein